MPKSSHTIEEEQTVTDADVDSVPPEVRSAAVDPMVHAVRVLREKVCRKYSLTNEEVVGKMITIVGDEVSVHDL